MKVKLEFSSPFIVGGRKLVSNYIESLDYIQGNVARAAFARLILNECECFREDEEIRVGDTLRKNWVYYRGEKCCENCRMRNLCQKFSALSFSYFYPEKAEVIPLTAMRCKDDESHGFIDVLIDKKQCKKCVDGRVEFVTGLRISGKEYKVGKKLVTRSAIDRFTKTAKNGYLHSVAAVDYTSLENNIKRNVFEGYIEGIDEEDLKVINILRVGSLTSVGYGICKIVKLSDNKESKEKALEKMKVFNRRFKENNEIKDCLNYFAFKLISDAKLKFNTENKDYIDTKGYKRIWKEALGLKEDYEVNKIYAETFNFRGYDTSKIEEDKRENTVTMVQKGSVFVLGSQKSFEKIYEEFLSLKGFGEENENGFGNFEIYYGTEC